MAAVSFHDAHVVVRYWQYCGVSCIDDQVYTTQAEAQAVADQENAKREEFLGTKPPECKVMRLTDFIDEEKREARWEGQQSERDRCRD